MINETPKLSPLATWALLAFYLCACAAPMIALAFAAACSPRPSPVPACEALSTRCEGSVVQLCTPDGAWEPTVDCAEVEPGAWRCDWDGQAKTHTCVKE